MISYPFRGHYKLIASDRDEQFLSRFTNSRCAGYILFLGTYFDNLTNLIVAKPGFPLVKSLNKVLVPRVPGL